MIADRERHERTRLRWSPSLVPGSERMTRTAIAPQLAISLAPRVRRPGVYT